MCGIVGWLGGAPPGDLSAGLAALEHRGPSGTATWQSRDGRCRLGLTRLALVGPDQPAKVACASEVASVSNGELYDYEALAAQLGVAASVDTDLIPWLWRKHGPALLGRLRGPLAAALCDEQSGELVLLRDAVGKRPLFFVRTATGAAFASEQKALKALLPSLEVSPRFVEHVLLLGRARETLTLFEGVETVEPGECVRISAEGVRRERVDALAPGSANVDDVLVALLEAVRLRRPAAPVSPAIALGGMDSMALSELFEHPPAFTVDRDGPETAAAIESRSIAGAARPHLLAQPRPTRESTRRALWHLETVDSAASWGLAASTLALGDTVAASRHEVLFTGEGADEIFLGYRWQRRALEPLPEAIFSGRHAARLVGPWREALAGFTSRERACFLAVPVPLMMPAEVDRLAGRPCRATLPLPQVLPKDPLEAARALQLQSLRIDMHALPVLHNDRLFMARGIETRMPYLDREVIDAALGLDLESLLGTEKPFVRALFLKAYGRPAPPKKGMSGAEFPPLGELAAWAHEIARRGPRHVEPAVLEELATSESSVARELSWRAVLLEELCDVMETGRA